jgi:hypothetical protein
MKSLVLMLLSILTINVFAQEKVILDKNEVFISSDQAILVRTNSTPDKVTLRMVVPMRETGCMNYSYRPVTITSSSRCGYDLRPVISSQVIRHCVARDSRGNCIRYSTVRSNRSQLVRVARTCVVQERYCAEVGTFTETETDGVVLKFKNANSLTAEQTEEFSIKGRQNHVDGLNIVYDLDVVSSLQAYEVKNRGILGLDKIVIEGK